MYKRQGKAGKRYAEAKLKELGQLELADVKVNEDYAIIMDRLAYSTKEMALKIAKDLGCEGFHEHEFEGQTWYMPCEFHSKDLSTINVQKVIKRKMVNVLKWQK